MINPLLLLIGLLGIWTVFGSVGAYVAHRNKRDPFQGAVLAALLGPLGVLFVAIVPPAERSRKDTASDDFEEL